MSGIYIPNIKMPKTCMKCFCLDPQWARCQILGKGFSEDEEPMKSRPKWCPLIDIQEHGQLIDVNALSMTDFEIATCALEKGNPYKNGLEYLLKKIENAPIIIQADKDGIE